MRPTDQMSRIEQAEHGLSAKQRSMLAWALNYVEAMEARKDDLALDQLENGITWQPSSKSDAVRAATSRALSRLEGRGLVERIAPGGRTVAIKLTILGRLVALRMRQSQ
jgi:hypothetical protein